MVLTFRDIHIENFLSFDRADINLDRNSYVLIRGENDNPVDNAVSNGSGKSAIFDALVWVLTGTTTRECKNVTNIHASNGAKVSLIFGVDNAEYNVTRTKDYRPLGSSLTILCNGEDVSGKGIRDSEKLLQEYLPDLTASLLGSVIILGQGLPQRFSKNTPSGRKDVLEKLCKSDFMIEDLKNKVSIRRNDLQKEQREVEDELQRLTTVNEQCELLIQSTQNRLQNMPSASELLGQVAKEKESLELLIAERDALQNVDELKAQIDTNKAVVMNLQRQMYQEEQDLLRQQEEVKNGYEPLLVTLRAEQLSLKNYIQSNESVRDVCPTCGQKLQGVHKIDCSAERTKLTQLNSELATLTEQRDIQLKELADVANEKGAALMQQRDSVEALCKQQDAEYSNVTKQRRNLDDNIHKAELTVQDYEHRHTSLQQSIQDLQQQIDETSVRIDETKTKILYKTNEKEDVDARLKVVNKMMNALTRDFRGYLLSNVIDFMSSRCKFYSQQVFGNENIGLQLVGNAIEISFDGKDYSNLSGGERQRVDIILQLSIRDMLCTFMGFSSNILVLDEFIDGLDSTGCEQVLDLISHNLGDVGTVYIITHHASVAIPTDDEIVVVKGPDKMSRVR